MARIILVEDDADVLTLLEHTLRAAGYEIDSVTTVAAALSLLCRHAYDLALADGELGDGTGMKVADAAAKRAQRR